MKIVKKRELYKRYEQYSVYSIYKQIGIDKNGQPIWKYLYKTCCWNAMPSLYLLKKEVQNEPV